MPAVDSSKVASPGAAAHNAAEETHSPARSSGVGSPARSPGADSPAARNTPAAVG